METVKLSRRQSAHMAELSEDHRGGGVERRAPLVRKPGGQIIRIQQDGRPDRRDDRWPGAGRPPFRARATN
jgi:hypothetical protein